MVQKNIRWNISKERGEKLAHEIPNATLVRLENASHWLQQDTPKEFANEVIKFLS